MKVRAKDQIPKKVLSHGEFVPIKRSQKTLKIEETLSDFCLAKMSGRF